MPTLAEGSAEATPDHRNEELLAEARILRQHKSRLETRMQILEDHNKQLESQLQRLRELLLQVRLELHSGGSSLLQEVGTESWVWCQEEKVPLSCGSQVTS